MTEKGKLPPLGIDLKAYTFVLAQFTPCGGRLRTGKHELSPVKGTGEAE